MNERIQELAEESGLYHQLASGAPYPSAMTAEECNSSYNKFAELLIRECINIAYEYDKPKLSGPGLAIASNIESHFDIYIEEDGRFVK